MEILIFPCLCHWEYFQLVTCLLKCSGSSESHRLYSVQRQHAINDPCDWSATEPDSAHLPEPQQHKSHTHSQWVMTSSFIYPLEWTVNNTSCFCVSPQVVNNMMMMMMFLTAQHVYMNVTFFSAQSNCGGRSVRVWGRSAASVLTSTASPSSVSRRDVKMKAVTAKLHMNYVFICFCEWVSLLVNVFIYSFINWLIYFVCLFMYVLFLFMLVRSFVFLFIWVFLLSTCGSTTSSCCTFSLAVSLLCTYSIWRLSVPGFYIKIS